MAMIDSGLGWKCDSNYYVSDAGTLITYPNGTLSKVNAGAAIVGYITNQLGWYCLNVMSTDPEFCELSATNNSCTIFNSRSTVIVNGVQWHFTAMYNNISSYNAESYMDGYSFYLDETSSTTEEQRVRALLTAANVEIAIKIPTIDYVHSFVEGVESETATRVNVNKAAIGTLSSLTTMAKTDAVSAINELNSIKQDKNLSSAITVDGTSQTTVEGALSAINNFTSAKISDIYANLGIYGNDVYGLQVDYQNYIYTRLCGAVGKTAGTDFNSFAPWSGIKRCNLADNGTINAYYGDVSYTEDGSNGQCMVEIPKFYYRVVPLKTEPIGDSVGGKLLRKANYYISATKYEGFKTHPLFVKPDGTERDKAYISAYEASIYDVSESTYILDDAQVADFTASTGDKLSSIANAKPCSGRTQNLTRANSEILATNHGMGWHCMDVKAVSAVQLLFMIEYGALNSQNAIGLGVVYRTDDGSTNMSEITGTTSSLGNSTGMANGTNGLVSVSYRGVENFYGNIWKFVEGINLWGDGTLRGGQPYICNDYTFTESTKTGYTAAKFTVTNANNYISAFGYDPDFDWLFLPSECMNADSNYPVGDYDYVEPNLSGYRIPFLGASWNDSTRAGAFFWALYGEARSRNRNFSVRLMYVS